MGLLGIYIHAKYHTSKYQLCVVFDWACGVNGGGGILPYVVRVDLFVLLPVIFGC